MVEMVTDASGDWRLSPLAGLPYETCLRIIHRHLRPRTYLEIDTEIGKTLPFASCPSIAVGMSVRNGDPGRKPACHIFQMTSDAFFAAHDPVTLLGGRVDLAFLHGVHLCEFLLRDFINVERCCSDDGMIVLLDCVPLDPHMAVRGKRDPEAHARSAYPGWWTGDVWKTVAALRRFRPDLSIEAFDAQPTGLVTITGLSPGSSVLTTQYREVLAAMNALDRAEDYRAYLEWLDPVSTRALEAVVASFAVAA